MEAWEAVNIVLSLLYGVLCVWCVSLLVRIKLGRHKMISYQTLFMGLCVGWTLLRMIFFASYGHGLENSQYAVTVLLWVPINIQFATFSLLVLYYANTVYSERRMWAARKRLMYFCYSIPQIILAGLLFAWIFVTGDDGDSGDDVTDIRQYASAGIFLVLFFATAYFARELYNMFPALTHSMIPFSQRLLAITTVHMLVVFLSRFIYNVCAGLRVVTIYLEGDNTDAAGAFAVYTFWEIAPVTTFILLFRNIPKTTYVPPPALLSHPDTNAHAVARSGGHVFHDPNRYDRTSEDNSAEEDAVSRNYGSFSTSQNSNVYGQNPYSEYGRPLAGVHRFASTRSTYSTSPLSRHTGSQVQRMMAQEAHLPPQLQQPQPVALMSPQSLLNQNQAQHVPALESHSHSPLSPPTMYHPHSGYNDASLNYDHQFSPRERNGPI
ncbi:hypothetical protein CAOG_01315 [Capsaspora owczarzaki ATCC 30864]|uniref:hypothetical protein n=1 Tax=Capsaspora owczarzaki (strain ATCC 30864) TaxID=595528 RepID=UPI000352656D|nr:hypothetical protein CAOG_01315 [Capsaspora owczarzaki ATCC 30864]|eukprot:XP_004349835.2 hypothetical protein CAOG_01315 [Capsaspora owczarzaki ATCC 30864]